MIGYARSPLGRCRTTIPGGWRVACSPSGLSAVTAPADEQGKSHRKRSWHFAVAQTAKLLEAASDDGTHRDGGKLILDTYSHVRPKHSARMAKLMRAEWLC